MDVLELRTDIDTHKLFLTFHIASSISLFCYFFTVVLWFVVVFVLIHPYTNNTNSTSIWQLPKRRLQQLLILSFLGITITNKNSITLLCTLVVQNIGTFQFPMCIPCSVHCDKLLRASGWNSPNKPDAVFPKQVGPSALLTARHKEMGVGGKLPDSRREIVSLDGVE